MASLHVFETSHEALDVFVELLRVVKTMYLPLNHFGVLRRTAKAEVEERAEMAQKCVLSTQHDLVVPFTAFKHKHFVVQWDLLVIVPQFISHFHELAIIQNIHFEFCIQGIGIVRVAEGRAGLASTSGLDVWKYLWRIEVDVLVGLVEEGVESVSML